MQCWLSVASTPDCSEFLTQQNFINLAQTIELNILLDSVNAL